MVISNDGVYIPDSFETIRDDIQNKQEILGTSFSIFESTVYQSMSNPIITGIYNNQSLLASLPDLVSNELKMQQTLIKRSPAITSDAITTEAKKSEFIDYAEIFNNTSGALIQLYIYKDGVDFSTVDLQYTADQIALITPVFVPYGVDDNCTLSLTLTSPVSKVSNIDVIMNVANSVTTDVSITTDPATLGTIGDTLKDDFMALFNETQTIGQVFDESFYQRSLFIDGLSSMNYTASVTACNQYEILRLGAVTVNGV